MKRTWFQFWLTALDSWLLRWLLSWADLKLVYRCEWGEFDTIYGSIDRQMGRPCHPDMGVAPPGALPYLVHVPVLW